MSQTPKAPEANEDSKKPGRSPWLLGFFTLALILTFFAGFFAQKSLHRLQVSDPVETLNQSLHSKDSEKDLRLEFEGLKEIPAGVGLGEWLEGFPAAERVRRVKAKFIAHYAFDPDADWDLRLDESRKVAVFQAPLPEFRGIRFTSSDLVIEAEPPLSAEENELARQFLEENLRLTLSQEEEARSAERLEAGRKRLLEFGQMILQKSGIKGYQIELRIAGDFALLEGP